MKNLPHLSLCVFKAVGDEVNWLVFGNWILLVPGHSRLELPHLRLVRQAVLQLSEGRQQASTVGLDLSLLAAQSKLDGKPETLQEREIVTGWWFVVALWDWINVAWKTFIVIVPSVHNQHVCFWKENLPPTQSPTLEFFNTTSEKPPISKPFQNHYIWWIQPGAQDHLLCFLLFPCQ